MLKRSSSSSTEGKKEEDASISGGEDGLLGFYSDNQVVTLPQGHRFPMDKYRATRLLLEGDLQLRSILTTQPAPLASEEELCLVHDQLYVRKIYFSLSAFESSLSKKLARCYYYVFHCKILPCKKKSSIQKT
jgi:acetoin utilization deacetylase AcuC-like enzyme